MSEIASTGDKRFHVSLEADDWNKIKHLFDRIMNDDGVYSINLDERHFSIALEDRSMCELDRSEGVVIEEAIKHGAKIGRDDNCFWFARLKIMTTRQGLGTKVMSWVGEIFDELGWWIVNCPNAYGGMSQEDLIKFYEKHGFKLIADQFMIREPKSK